MVKDFYLKVQAIKGWKKPIWYSFKGLKESLKQNFFIRTKLRGKTIFAFIKEVLEKKPRLKFEVKEAEAVLEFPKDKSFFKFLDLVSTFYFQDKLEILARFKPFFDFSLKRSELEFEKNNFKNLAKDLTTPSLSHEQEKVFLKVEKQIKKNSEFKPFLLHGVTGSGKTEVYKRLILKAFSEGKSVIFCLPEVSMAKNFEVIFKNFLKNFFKVFSYHSGTTEKEKKALWQSALNSNPILVLGVHLPVFLPLENLGLIIIDEEHESGFEEKKFPKINSREALLWRAKLANIPILMGSATPDLTNFKRFKDSENYLRLDKRFFGSFPEVEVVKIFKKEEKKKFKSSQDFWLTKELEEQIGLRLLKKEQVVIFINRRGYRQSLYCRGCGECFSCKNCSVSLTVHKSKNDISLKCHYCQHFEFYPKKCSFCSSETFIGKGIGTQKLISILEKKFPEAKIARGDLDTVKQKSWPEVLENFKNGKIDILVGTKSITKGFDFEKVTLVGVICADLDFNIPSYKAREEAYQQIVQVAGRAGRRHFVGKVILQVLKEDKILSQVSEKNYLSFLKEELEVRKRFNYPPFCIILNIFIFNKKIEVLEPEALRILKKLEDFSENLSFKVKILGPADPPVSKVSKVFIKKIIIKIKNSRELGFFIKNMPELKGLESSLKIYPEF